MSQPAGHSTALSVANRTDKPITELLTWECDDTRGVLLFGLNLTSNCYALFAIKRITLGSLVLWKDGKRVFASPLFESTENGSALLLYPWFGWWPFKRTEPQTFLEVQVELLPGALLSIAPITQPRRPVPSREEGYAT